MTFHRTIVFQVAKVFVIVNLVVILIFSLLPLFLLSNNFDNNIKASLKNQFQVLEQSVLSGEAKTNETIEELSDDGFIVIIDKQNPKTGMPQGRFRPRPSIPFQAGTFVKVGGVNRRPALFYTDIINDKQVFLGKNIEDFEKTKLGFITPLIIINTTLILVFMLIAWFLSKRIMKPITAVSDYLQSIQDNQKTVVTNQNIQPLYKEDQPHEIAILTQAFDKAIYQIHQSVAREREFLQDASHELRTPLTGIMSSLELIDTDNLTHQQTSKLDTIKLLSSKLKTITNELLYLTRGQVNATNEPNDMSQIITSIINGHKSITEAKGLNLKVDDVDNFSVQAHPSDLQKLISNLIDNAIKYTPNAGTISIKLDQRKLIVSDTGIGMSETQLGKLGERFARDTQAIQLNYEGVGLGLSIVYKIIGQYGWNIAVNSKPGEGTSVTIGF